MPRHHWRVAPNPARFESDRVILIQKRTGPWVGQLHGGGGPFFARVQRRFRRKAGLVRQKRRRGTHRRWRPRRPLPGMLLHLDGSSHAWLGEGRRYDLLVVLDECLRTAFGLATHKGFAS